MIRGVTPRSPKRFPTQVPDEEAEVKEGEEAPTKSVPKTTQVLPTPTFKPERTN